MGDSVESGLSTARIRSRSAVALLAASCFILLDCGFNESVPTPSLLGLSLDRHRALTGTEKGTVKIWDIEKRQPIRTLNLGINAQRGILSQDERYLALPNPGRMTEGANLTVVDLTNGSKQTIFPPGATKIRPISFTSDNRTIVLHIDFSLSDALALMDRETGQVKKVLLGNHWESFRGPVRVVLKPPAPKSFVYEPESDRLVVGDPAGSVGIWRVRDILSSQSRSTSLKSPAWLGVYRPDDTDDAAVRLRVPVPVNQLLPWIELDFIPQSNSLAIATGNGVGILDTKSGKIRDIFKRDDTVHRLPMYRGLAVSPDGRLLCASANTELKCWEMVTGNVHRAYSGAGFSYAFWPDNELRFFVTIPDKGPQLRLAPTGESVVDLWSPWADWRASPEAGSWDPWITTLSYIRNDREQHSLRIQGGLSIDLKDGDRVSFEKVDGVIGFAENKRHPIFGRMTRIVDVPPPPWEKGAREVRIVIMPKKLGVGPRDACFDDKDTAMSEWIPLGDPDWSATLRSPRWKLTSDWESFKVLIQTRERGSEVVATAAVPEGGYLILDIAVGKGVGSMRQRVRRNIFSSFTRQFEDCNP